MPAALSSSGAQRNSFGKLYSRYFSMHQNLLVIQIGGFTGLVGDPSGKADERTPLGESKVSGNVKSLTFAIQKFFSNAQSYAACRIPGLRDSESSKAPEIANNVEWLGSLNLLDFLTSVGRHARVPTMIRKDRSVCTLMVIECSSNNIVKRSNANELAAGSLLNRVHIPAHSSVRLSPIIQQSRLHDPARRIRLMGKHYLRR